VSEARAEPAPGGVRVAAWGAAFYAAAQLAGAMLDANPTAAVAVQAVLAELGSGRLGVSWSDPDGPAQDGKSIARRAAIGAALGLGVGALVLGALIVTKLAKLAPNAPSFASLGIGLLVAGLASTRDELLLHGVILRVTEAAPVTARVISCGLGSAAATLASPSATLPEVVVAGVAGAAFGSLWLLDRGAWMPVAAHAAWTFGTGTLARGGLLDVRSAMNAWAGADAGFAGGWAAAVVVALAAAAGLYTTKRRMR
jgi:hypothetical protein